MMEPTLLFASKADLYQALPDRKIIQVRIGQQKYCATRAGNSVFLFETNCPHFDYPLVEANISGFGEVVCPWHGYRFSFENGQESQKRCRDLEVSTAYWNEKGELLVNI